MSTHIQNSLIELFFPDGSSEYFTLEAPNAADPFEFRPFRVENRGKFRDKNNKLRRSGDIYSIKWSYRYRHHSMNLIPLLAAKSITLAAPPNFSGTYGTHNVRLMNDQVVRNWLDGVVANDNKAGAIELQFERIDPLTWEELLDEAWFEAVT